MWTEDICCDHGDCAQSKKEYQKIIDSLEEIKTSILELSESSAKQGENPIATNTVILNLLSAINQNMYKGIPVVSQHESATIYPNILNVWDNINSDITITKGDGVQDIVNEYMVRFKYTSGELIFDWPEQIHWNQELTLVSGKTYEISILDNLGIWAEY